MASVLNHVMNLLKANFKTLPSLLPFLSLAPSSIEAIASLKSSGYLTVRDSRTGRSYTLPIINSAIEAMQFMWQSGLNVMDLGLQNTAVGESSITKVYVIPSLYPAQESFPLNGVFPFERIFPLHPSSTCYCPHWSLASLPIEPASLFFNIAPF